MRAGGEPHRDGRRFIVALLLLASLALAGCKAEFDRDQARLCRLAAVALAGSAGPLAILRQSAVTLPPADLASAPVPADPVGVRIDYEVGGRSGFVECGFGAAPDRDRLASVRTAQDTLSLPRLYALDRFWLRSPDAAMVDPMPIAGLGAAPRLPAHTAYPLQQLINALPGCAVYALLAVAYALVYGLIGRINLAFGAFAAVGGTAAAIAILATQRLGVAVALGVAVVAALVPPAAHGIAVARLVFTPLARATGQQILVATIGLALVLGEYMRLVQGSDPRWLGPMFDTPIAVARDASFVVTLTPIGALVSLLAGTISAGLALIMRFSGFGRNWRAYRDDPGAAALFGIGRARILGQTFALASACAGLAGGITVVVFGDISFAYAQVLGLKALTAAVLGGIGSVPGAFAGGLFIGLVESGWSAAFPIVNRDLVIFCILIATLVWRPGGFFGERDLVPRRV